MTTHATSDAERQALDRFTQASKQLLSERALQQRVDSKFIVSRTRAPEILDALRDNFRVVLSAGRPYGNYLTVYFDSPGFDLFHDHRRGRRPRHKVRIRQYTDRDLCFLETKTKDRYSVTTKQRFSRAAGEFDLEDTDLQSIRAAIGWEGRLQRAVEMNFLRVTLLGVEHEERITMDLSLWIRDKGAEVVFEDACIIELKQKRFDARSPGWVAMRSLGMRPHGISKYCVALAVLGHVDRIAAFRPAIRELERSSHA